MKREILAVVVVNIRTEILNNCLSCRWPTLHHSIQAMCL